MANEKGGLKPVKLGGGKQTRSLHIEDASGEEYKLRSIKKFITSKTLPADLQSEAAEDIVADGVSASYPYAALSVPALAKAAGVPFIGIAAPSNPRYEEVTRLLHADGAIAVLDDVNRIEEVLQQ